MNNLKIPNLIAKMCVCVCVYLTKYGLNIYHQIWSEFFKIRNTNVQKSCQQMF